MPARSAEAVGRELLLLLTGWLAESRACKIALALILSGILASGILAPSGILAKGLVVLCKLLDGKRSVAELVVETPFGRGDRLKTGYTPGGPCLGATSG